jgi:hypothetical protein
VSVEYCLEIIGDYPTFKQPIKVKSNCKVITFKCGCFLVPRCPMQGKLEIIKTCGYTIVNNQLAFNFLLNVNNVGKTPLTNVQYLDSVVIPVQFTLGPITITPRTLVVDTSTSGVVKISGNLGTINPGGNVPVSYTIPIASLSDPGTFIVTNTATASASGTHASATCSSVLNIVKLSAANCCNVTGNRITFKLTLTSVDVSPDTRINITDQLVVPPGLTVIFNDFGGCTATIAGSGSPVPLNTNVAGPITVKLQCNGIRVLQDGSAHKSLCLTVVSNTNFGTVTIQNTLQQVTLTDPSQQLFLGTAPLPLETDITVIQSLQCKSLS